MTAENVIPLRSAPCVDRPRAERAVAELLAALGYPVEGEHRLRTPQRVAGALAEMLTPSAFLPTTFPNDEGYDELVVARQVPFRSLCEHHLLPFYGSAVVGYLPGDRIVGLSKLARVVEHFAAGLQVQERLTQQIADWLQDHLGARGVGVVIEAEHLCMSLRGVQARGAVTVTSALRGDLRTDPRAREEFLSLAHRGQLPIRHRSTMSSMPPEPRGARGKPAQPGRAGGRRSRPGAAQRDLPRARPHPAAAQRDASGDQESGGGDLHAVAALGEPARRALYDYIAAQDRLVSRDEAADATGMKRPTAAFHLERLAEDGLLEVAFARLSGRTGPGAGRTAKLYRRSARQIEVSLPPRRYALAGEVLADAVEAAADGATPVRDAVAAAADAAGRRLARRHGRLADALAEAGFEPKVANRGDIVLANCPFHDLVVKHPALVCEMNLHLLRGLLAGLGEPAAASLDPAEGRCCVTITPR